MEIQVGDLVRIRDYEWISRDVGVVVEIKTLVHDITEREYVAVTALVGGKKYTFSAGDFTVVSRVERKEDK